MRNNTLTLCLACLVWSGTTAIVSAEPTSQPASTDWPQWRGPNRDGVAPAGPKLLDSWPASGPKLLWKSTEKIPSGREGGCGSLVVANGNAYLFAHFNKQTSKFCISTEDLKAWGWSADMPEDMAKKVNEVHTPLRQKIWDRNLTEDEWTNTWKSLSATLTPEQVKTFQPLIEARFHKGFQFYGQFLRELGQLADKEFDTYGAMAGAFKHTDDAGKSAYYDLFHPHNSDGAAVKSLLMAKCFAWTDTIYCFDAVTGKTLWKKELPGTAASAATYYFAASCTPTIAEGKCFVIGSAGLYCLDVKDGEVVWQNKAGYSNSSPLVQDGVVYVMAPKASAFDAKTGKQLWTNPKCEACSVSLVMWTSGGKKYLIGTSGIDVFCVNAQTGETAWSTFLCKLYGGGNDSTPVIVGDVLVMRANAALTAYKLTPEKAVPIWSADYGDRGSSPLVYKDHIYTFGKGKEGYGFYCLDLKTGAMIWKKELVYNETYSPVIADGKVICHYGTSDRWDGPGPATIMFRATAEKFEQLGVFNDTPAEFVTPTIAGGRMFLRLKDTVACYDLRAEE